MKPDFVMTPGDAAGEAQHVERLPVVGLRAHAAIEARDGPIL